MLVQMSGKSIEIVPEEFSLARKQPYEWENSPNGSVYIKFYLDFHSHCTFPWIQNNGLPLFITNSFESRMVSIFRQFSLERELMYGVLSFSLSRFPAIPLASYSPANYMIPFSQLLSIRKRLTLYARALSPPSPRSRFTHLLNPYSSCALEFSICKFISNIRRHFLSFDNWKLVSWTPQCDFPDTTKITQIKLLKIKHSSTIIYALRLEWMF